MDISEPILDSHDIQGHILRGFDTERLLLVGVKFGQLTEQLRMWLRSLGLRADSLAAIHRSRLARSIKRRYSLTRPSSNTTDCYLNIALSKYGLEQLGFSVAGIVDQSFRQPMGAISAALGDPQDANGQLGYLLGVDWHNTPDLMLLLGSDSEDRLALAEREMIDEAEMAGCEIIYLERGAILPDNTEHFGFRDGISQAGVRGFLSLETEDYLTPRYLKQSDPRFWTFAKPGQPLVWPGQFVFGYPTQREDPTMPGPVADGGEAWMKNGSFLVFRRLRQDVKAFQEFVSGMLPAVAQAFGTTVSEELCGAILVGRWKDGTPLVIHTDAPNPALAKDPFAVNYFQFANATSDMDVIDSDIARTIPGSVADPFGQRCPHIAHIRKVNPRDRTTNKGGPGQTLQFQVLRRGVPFGPPFSAQSQSEDRGLLFLAFMTSIDGQFRILNSDWMNNNAAPEAMMGHDLLVGQSNGPSGRTGTILGSLGNAKFETLSRWVISTGGAFMFLPSLSLLQGL